MMDDLDRRIVAALEQEPRASYRRLAAMTGTTTPTASARFRRLQDLGIIAGFRVVLGAAAGAVAEVVTAGAVPPAQVLERVAFDDGSIRWTCRAQDRAAFDAWADEHGGARYVTSGETSTARHQPHVRCHACHGALPERPIERTLAGRRHVFCCIMCEAHMKRRLQQIRLDG